MNRPGLADRFLEFLLAAFAGWTLVYHVCVTARFGTTVALVAWLPLLLGAAVFAARRPAPPDVVEPKRDRRSAPPRGLGIAAAGLALACAVLFAFHKNDVAWGVAWALWVAAASCGVAFVLLRRRADSVEDQRGSVWLERAGTVAWMLALAVLSLAILNPDDDDSYYLRLTAWIADNGIFPVRDVMFGDEVLPALYYPPAGSFDPLMGTIARLTGLTVPSLMYLFVTPLASGLAVLPLRRLLRTWAVPLPFVALSVALAFLLCDAAANQTFGSFFIGRIWQGKTILLVVLVPLLLALAHDYGRAPSRAGLARLFAAGVAGVGLSTTGIFLVPVIATGCMAALALRDRRAALAGFAATVAYPVAAAVVTKATGGRVPDKYFDSDVIAGDLVHLTLYRDELALIAVAALLIAPMLIPRNLAARMIAAIVLLVGVLYAPGLPLAIFHATDLGRVLWRLMWAIPVAALVGTLAVSLLRDRWPLPVRLAPAAALIAALVIFGTFPWADQSARGLVWPPVYKRFPEELASARAASRAAEPGDLVFSTRKITQSVGILRSDVTTVNPRGFFTTALEEVPAAQVPERKRLHNIITYGFVEPPGSPQAKVEAASVRADLAALDVDVACPLRFQERLIVLLESAGWRPVTESRDVVCFRRDA